MKHVERKLRLVPPARDVEPSRTLGKREGSKVDDDLRRAAEAALSKVADLVVLLRIKHRDATAVAVGMAQNDIFKAMGKELEGRK